MTFNYLIHFVYFKYYLYNEEIEIDKDVRLIDTKGKLVGVYNLKEALKKTDKMKQDLVLINEKVKPAICKVMNYKETLFRQFIKEISGKEQLEKTSTYLYFSFFHL